MGVVAAVGVTLPVWVYVVVGVLAVAMVVWGFVSNSKNKKARPKK